jgi:hypothetical protein
MSGDGHDHKQAFRDKFVEPTPDAIEDALGPAWEAWQAAEAMFAEIGGGPIAWKYYNDGQWLARSLKGKQTLAWLAIDERGFFYLTSYFAKRLFDVLLELPELDDDVRAQLESVTPFVQSWPAHFTIRTTADLDKVRPVVAFRAANK